MIDGKYLIALDFDGVICDSVRETAASGWRAARKFWPREITTADPPEHITERFIQLRPYLHTGFEAIPFIRLALDGIDPNQMTDTELEIAKHEVFKKSGCTKEEFLQSFSQTRDQWIRADENDWLGRNRFYPGTIEVLEKMRKEHEVFIITTKQSRFTEKLLRGAGSELERDRIFGLDTGKPKEVILQELHCNSEFEKLPAHFVEDRLVTLRRVQQVSALNDIHLHLCDWGYNSKSDRTEADNDPAINLLHSLEEILPESG